MKKISLFVVLLFSSIACAKDNNDGTTHTLIYNCSREKQNIEYWIKNTPVIFTGEVEEVRLKIDERDLYSNSCWVKLRVIENIKGISKDETWMRALYEPYNQKTKQFKNIKDLENCTFKKDKSYIIFGTQIGYVFLNQARNFIQTVNSGNGNCMPNFPLENSTEELKFIHSNVGR